jgi:hypothetical protein
MATAAVAVDKMALILDFKQAVVVLQQITVVVAETVLSLAQLVAYQMLQPLVAVLVLLVMAVMLMELMAVLVVQVAEQVEPVLVAVLVALVASAQFLFITKEKYKCLILQ